jgi:c-di-GMP phosphodiesterase
MDDHRARVSSAKNLAHGRLANYSHHLSTPTSHPVIRNLFAQEPPMFGFIKRLIGGNTAPKRNADPFEAAAKKQTLPMNTEAPTPARSTSPVIVQREEIIDEKTRICGYRFSVHSPDSPRLAEAQDTLDALAHCYVAAFAERRLALINLQAEDWSALDFQRLIGRNTVFILPLPKAQEDQANWLSTSSRIKQAGAKIAVAGNEIIAQQALLGNLVDFIFIDFSAYSLNLLEQTIKTLKARFPQASLIAENISRWPEQRYCIAHGISCCMGPFTTAQDEQQQSGEISQSRLVIIEMLNGLRQDADLTDIAQVAKRDPGVVVKLIAMANSPMLGLSQSVTSIDQAIMILGREQLYRWLSIGMFRMDEGSPRDDVLLELALTRGRFLEIIGHIKHGKKECDELFLLGLLSLLDILLRVPMSTVVQRINLSNALSEVLLSSSGPLGRYLMLVIAMEKGHGENVARLAAQLEIPLDVIETASAEAQGWAENAMSMNS